MAPVPPRPPRVPGPADCPSARRWFFRQTQAWVDWSPILLAASALLLTYSALLLVSPAARPPSWDPCADRWS